MEKMLGAILKVAKENDFQLTKNRDFVEWAAWHNSDGSPPCSLTDEGIELCF
jgi:hypothetical protein